MMTWFIVLPHSVKAQQDTIVDQIYSVLILDSLIVSADRQEPDIKSMIRQTMNDTTFYRAFQRLRRQQYRFSSELYFYQSDWIPYTYMRSLRDQIIKDGMRKNEIIDEYKDRKITNRKGEYNFYTAKMYDRIFFTDSPTPVPSNWSGDPTDLQEADSRMGRYIQNLKLLLFAPGTKIDLPLMGDKTAIFTEDQMKKYRYELTLDTSSYPIPVYEFLITADPQYPENETVIKELRTVFSKEDKQVLNRSYRLAYNTIAYSFDVSMHIQIEHLPTGYIPTRIAYDGWWKVPFKKAELCRFTFQIESFGY